MPLDNEGEQVDESCYVRLHIFSSILVKEYSREIRLAFRGFVALPGHANRSEKHPEDR